MTIVLALSARPIAPPTSEEQAAILDEVREYALTYSANLPDFICTQVTTRFAAPLPGTRYGGAAGDSPKRFASIGAMSRSRPGTAIVDLALGFCLVVDRHLRNSSRR